MTDHAHMPASFSPTKQALLKIRELKQRLAAAEQRRSSEPASGTERGTYEPIAIVSMACRFPRRSRTPEDFWESLLQATDEVTEIPADRWDLDAYYDPDMDAPGKMYARHGVFLDDLDQMDPEFFGISPREATWVDPQQRLLLEVSWEALERAGWVPEEIADETGYFAAWMHNDYQNEASDAWPNLNPYIATGSAGSFLSGRLSYYLGLHGPSVAIDTACSSSLVALHLACQSLQGGECHRALVGGVNAIVSPTTNILTCKLKALSPSGHSRPFDARADGYLRGEGCGVVALRRLADAERDGDPILAVIRGSAVGHNGFSSGLTAPNPLAQERVLRDALRRAELQPTDVDYLEAHGTGTELGDPIEMRAAANVLGERRSSERPLLVGSVKSNIGHLEAAAGMAGLIKVLLALEHETLPVHRNFEEPNPHIPWDQIPVRIVTEPTAWPNGRRRIAGISAFGMSGTNAHVVLEGRSEGGAPAGAMRQTPPEARAEAATVSSTATDAPASSKIVSGGPWLIPLSARSDAALQELAGRYTAWLTANPDADLADVAASAGTGRRHFDQRAALVVSSAEQTVRVLAELKHAGDANGLFRGQARRAPRLAWQFTGQGSQYHGMARGLYATQPVFRAALDECNSLVKSWRDRPLLDVLFEDVELIDRTEWTQPCLFAVQMGLAHLLEHWGIRPDMVLGHSVGQYAAACVAGILSWKDGLWLISERGRCIGELPDGGAMVAIFAQTEMVEELLRQHPKVSLAAWNGTHAVVSGPEDAVESLAAQFVERGLRTHRLATSHAFHSSLMDPALESFGKIADQVACHSARLPLVCNMTGQPLPASTVVDGDYWKRHIREPVRYAESVQALRALDCDVLLELGPQPILTRMAAAVWDGPAGSLLSCLDRAQSEPQALLSAVAQLYVHGLTPDFSKLDANRPHRRLVLPTYPFQRRRFWGPARPQAYEAEQHLQHPLLGARAALPGLSGEVRFESWIGPRQPAWLEDHRVLDDHVFPGAAFVEMGLAASESHTLRDVRFEQPLRPAQSTCLHTVVRSDDPRQQTVLEIYSATRTRAQWNRHVSATLGPTEHSAEDAPSPAAVDLAALQARCSESMPADEFYRALQDLGLQYGPEFQTIRELRYSDSDVLVRLEAHSDLRAYTLPPTVLDGALHALAIGLIRDAEPALFVPVGMERFSCFRKVTGRVWCHATWTQPTGEVRSADLTLCDEQGQVLAEAKTVTVRRLNRSALRQLTGSGPQQLLYQLNWQPSRLPPTNAAPARWLVIHTSASACDGTGEPPALPREVCAALRKRSQDVTAIELMEHGTGTTATDEIRCVSPEDTAQWNQVIDEWLGVSGSTTSVPGMESSSSRSEPPSRPGPRPAGGFGIIWFTASETASRSGQTVSGPGSATEGSRLHCAGLLALLDALRGHHVRKLERGLQLVTRGSVLPLADETGSVDLSVCADQGQYWGLGRVIGAEQPELGCRLIDLPWLEAPAAERQDTDAEAEPALPPASEITSLVDVLLNDTDENQIAIRDSRVLVPRLEPLKIPKLPRAEPVPESTPPTERRPRSPDSFGLDPDASYLITGGLGMLGRQAALWLAQRGARQLVLVSRRPPSDAAQDLIAAVEQLGCRVRVEQADVGDDEAVRALLARIEQIGPPLRGVIHAAGVLDDALLADQSWPRFQKVLAAKAGGARWLHELTSQYPLDFFVLYSSAASVLGSPGQSNYATANAFLDALAWERHARGLPALSVNWGPWTEGMADDAVVQKRLALQGITPLSVEEAHASLERLLTVGAVQATVLDVDWRRLVRGLGSAPPQLLRNLAPAAASSAVHHSVLVEKLRSQRGAARERLLVETLQSELQQVLSTDEAPDPQIPLIDMGLDSLMAVEFSTRLQQQLGDEFAVSPTLLFDYPTISALSGYLLELVTDLPAAESTTPSPSAATSVAPSSSTSSRRNVEQEDIVIVGMSCRFPGAAGLDEFWHNLQNGVDAIREVPPDRWNVDEYYSPEPAPGKMSTREGGFIDGIREFDAEFFNISDQEACWTDPQHRLLLEVSWEALEDAGLAAHPLADPRVGVFMGIMSQDYAEALSSNDVEVIEGFQGAGLSHSAGVGRISYAFGFEGPSVAVDSASSSSLVAVCQAAKSLRDGECNVALAGGVNAILTPTNTLLLSRAGMLAPDGRCKSFSAAANGFARGEGCGVIVLKRRKDAEREGNRILAAIRGSAVSHNGFSGGITTPNGRSQERVLREALEAAALQPADVQYLEAHGTGTPLGDPIEIRAAAAVLGKGRSPETPLLVGSVKANIGHLEAAGGISGLIKTVLAMQHGLIPRQLHFEEPSPHVPWQQLPLRIVTEPTPWPDPQPGRPRMAGVTALGLTGTNAHIVLSAPLEAAPAPDRGTGDNGHASAEPRDDSASRDRQQHLLVLSARKPQALRELAERYDQFLKTHPQVPLADLCYSAATGRRHFEQRAAIVVNSISQTRHLLRSLADGEAAQELHTGLARTTPLLGWLFPDRCSRNSQTATTPVHTLYETEPVFRDVIDRCDMTLTGAAAAPPAKLPPAVSDWIEKNSSDKPLRHSVVQQSVREGRSAAEARLITDLRTFAVQMALARLWQSWGVDPDVVAGFGIGQYSAACLTGVLHLDSALWLIAARNVLPEQAAADGTTDPSVEKAFSLEEFEMLADTVDYFPPDRQLLCELSGRAVPVHRLLGGGYWRRHCEEMPQRQACLQTLQDLRCEVVVRLGACDASTEITGLPCEPDQQPPAWVDSFEQNQEASTSLLRALGQLYVMGITADFREADRPWKRQHLSLPTYPFQRSEYWITDVANRLSNADTRS